MNQELKTSAMWNAISGIHILDPDGWDRSNFQFSFHEELITKEEFNRRVSLSTVKLKPESEKIDRMWRS